MAQPWKGPRSAATLRIPDRLLAEIEEHRAGSGYASRQDYLIAMLERAAAAGLFPKPLQAAQDRLPLSA
jgi:hypothetical protein